MELHLQFDAKLNDLNEIAKCLDDKLVRLRHEGVLGNSEDNSQRFSLLRKGGPLEGRFKGTTLNNSILHCARRRRQWISLGSVVAGWDTLIQNVNNGRGSHWFISFFCQAETRQLRQPSTCSTHRMGPTWPCPLKLSPIPRRRSSTTTPTVWESRRTTRQVSTAVTLPDTEAILTLAGVTL